MLSMFGFVRFLLQLFLCLDCTYELNLIVSDLCAAIFVFYLLLHLT